ncbi:phosphatase regulatory subunit family protein [Loa loa]|uniref:Phosphatase regulatory subunit family protein n=1 Tax=Loa loa TaxID=7209 RepID=A0A1I7VE26_LOALO|nr:phosphatase regulatory subunit family protein [Loa loa]EFO25016.1 phosphatase regulatory subunit family protein [Loa loa]
MLVNIGCGDSVLSKIGDRNNTTICNNGKSAGGILRCKSERTSSTQRRRIKKNVRFSDCFDLEQAEYSINTQAEKYSKKYQMVINRPCSSVSELQLQKYFWLPTENELRWLVGEQCVHLESVRWFGRGITGVVRVKNLGYEKKIEILYTFDDWTTSYTIKGAYTESPSPQEDRFSFCIFLPFLKLDLCIYFCIRYECGGMAYWDSNCGGNYKFVCHSVATFEENTSKERTDCSNSSFNPFFDSDCSIFF